MKLILALVLVVFSAPALALQCPDGVSRAATLGNCPPHQTNIAVDTVGQTSFRITGQNDAQGIGAKRYTFTSATPYPAGCTAGHYTHADLSSPNASTAAAAKLAKASCTRYDLIMSGSGSSLPLVQETLVYEGGFAQTVTGATAGTTYYAHSLVVSQGTCQPYPNHTTCTNTNRGKLSLVETVAVTTASGGGSPGYQPVNDDGQERYVGTGGSDVNDGLSNATRKLTLAATASCVLPTGTNIALLNTSVFLKQQLTVCWSGSSTDWNKIGSYKLDGGGVPVWVQDNIRGESSTDTKAILRGGLDPAKLVLGTESYTAADLTADNLSGEYACTLCITDVADFTEVLNVRVENIRFGYPVSANGGATAFTSNGQLHHLIFDGVDVVNVGGTFVLFENGVRNVVFRNGYAAYGSTCWQQKLQVGFWGPTTTLCNSAGWPGGISFVRSNDAFGLVEDTDIRWNLGEAFGCSQFVSKVIFRGMRAGGVWSRVFSTDGSFDCIVENSILVGSRADIGYFEGAGVALWGTAFIAGSEDFVGVYAYQPQNIVARNVLTVGTGDTYNCYLEAQQQAWGKRCGMKIYGVTGIDNTYQDIFDYGGDTNAAYVSAELDMRNTAFWSQDLTAAKSCDYTKTATISVLRRNFWYLEPVHARCKGTGDVYNTVPQLTQSSFSWWEAINAGNWPTFQDAKPAAGSPLVNAGEDLGSTPLWTEAQWADGGVGQSWILNQIKDVRNNVVTVSQWLQPNYHDAENNVRGCGATAREIGVLERC